MLGLLLAFTAFATYQIHSPGLYMDEMDFVAAATGKRPYRSWLGIPLMVFPYIGALKAWIYTPIFALFGVSAVSIRLPVVLISCGTLALGYTLVRRNCVSLKLLVDSNDLLGNARALFSKKAPIKN